MGFLTYQLVQDFSHQQYGATKMSKKDLTKLSSQSRSPSTIQPQHDVAGFVGKRSWHYRRRRHWAFGPGQKGIDLERGRTCNFSVDLLGSNFKTQGTLFKISMAFVHLAPSQPTMAALAATGMIAVIPVSSKRSES